LLLLLGLLPAALCAFPQARLLEMAALACLAAPVVANELRTVDRPQQTEGWRHRPPHQHEPDWGGLGLWCRHAQHLVHGVAEHRRRRLVQAVRPQKRANESCAGPLGLITRVRHRLSQ
jgi:hypothetical protein